MIFFCGGSTAKRSGATKKCNLESNHFTCNVVSEHHLEQSLKMLEDHYQVEHSLMILNNSSYLIILLMPVQVLQAVLSKLREVNVTVRGVLLNCRAFRVTWPILDASTVGNHDMVWIDSKCFRLYNQICRSQDVRNWFFLDWTINSEN